MENTVGGLDAILAEIKRESDAVISDIRENAAKEAEGILSAAKSEAAGIISAAENRAAKIYKSESERLKQSAAHSAAQKRLAARQGRISAVISEAAAGIGSGADAEYFSLLTELLKRYGTDRAGRLLMSGRDLSAAPKSFTDFVRRELPGLSAEASDRVKSGFIICYSDVDIEENCTIDALAEAAADNIRGRLVKELGI